MTRTRQQATPQVIDWKAQRRALRSSHPHSMEHVEASSAALKRINRQPIEHSIAERQEALERRDAYTLHVLGVR